MRNLINKILSILIVVMLGFSSVSYAYLNNNVMEDLNVVQWQQVGYTGKGVTIVVHDSNKDNHGNKVIEVIKSIAPDVKIIRQFDSHIINAMNVAIEDGNVQLLTSSISTDYWGGNDAQTSNNAYNAGIFLNGSAGNTPSNPSEYVKSHNWFSVGAGYFFEGKFIRADYSAIGHGLDVMSVAGVGTKYGWFDGTSCSTPFVTGMTALYYERFKEQNGRFPRVNEARDFIRSNSIDLEEEGYDSQTGYGLFILPKLELIKEANIDKVNKLAVRAYNSSGQVRYIHRDFLDEYIYGRGYRLIK